MGKKEDLIKEIRIFKEKVEEDFSDSKVILFGSMATGKTHKDSDVDLMIVSDRFKNINSIKRASLMYNYWTLRIPVDFLCYTRKEFEERKKRVTIVREAVLNGIEVN